MKRARFVFFIAVMASLLPAAFGQNSVILGTEIQNIEQSINRSGVSAVQRHDSLVRLARLRQLSGDIEGAARNWLEAAAAVPNRVDDDALLACAYCLAAMGEWDRASTALEPLLTKSARARFLNIGIGALNTGNLSALVEIAGSSEYSQMKSEIYYLLWKASSGNEAERWRQRLVSEFPQSPEGKLAAGGNSQTVVLRQNPFWLLIGGLDSLPLTAGVPAPSQTTPVQTTVPAPSGVKLQTGLYSQENNAQAQAARLRQAGYVPSIEQRAASSGIMWAVTVPAGADTNHTIKELREAGFDSFPLR